MSERSADNDRKLLEWLQRWEMSLSLLDLEEQAFGDMTYAEYCQFQEWAHEYDTVGDLLERWGESAAEGGERR